MLNFHYSSTLYTLILTISFWCWAIFELWVVITRDIKTIKNGSRSGDRGSRYWVIGALGLGIGFGFSMPNTLPQFNIQNYFIVFFSLGIALIWAGIVFRFWAIRTLGKFFKTRVIIQENNQLITSGPYAYLRNPSYTGTLMTLLGFGLGAGNWLSVVIFIVAGLIAYARRIAVEDQALQERFGKTYEDYRKKTWALIPFIW